MTTQPEALRLAALLDINHHEPHVEQAVAAELRRLPAEVEALRAAQGEQEPWGYAVEGRIFVGAALPEHVQKMAAEHDFRVLKLYTSHVATSQEPQHPDDAAVDALSAAMKAKLAKQRAKGYGGWDTDCTQQRLSDMLRNHIDKGDPVDVANFCAFLFARGEGISAPVATQGEQPMVNMTPPATARDRWMYEQGRLAEREIICAAIKAEDDHCVTKGDYMLDSDDCIKVARGQWVRPVYEDAVLSAIPPVAKEG